MTRALPLCMMLAAAPLPAFAQGTAPAPLAGKLLITGSSTMASISAEIARRFTASYPRVSISGSAGILPCAAEVRREGLV